MTKSSKLLETLTRRLTETDVLVKGYFLIAFENISQIFVDKFTDLDISMAYIKAVTNVGLPEATLRTSQFAGKMGYVVEVPSGVTRGNRLQLDVVIDQSAEIFSLHNYWFNYIDAMFSYINGGHSKSYANQAAVGKVGEGLNDLKEYGAVFHYWLLTPSFQFVSGFIGHGVYPTKLISDEMGSSLQNETGKASLNYRVDFWKIYDIYDNTFELVAKNSVIAKVYDKLISDLEKNI